MKNWKDIEANADAYKAVGIERVYLSKYDGWAEDYPWHLATKVEEGGSHRMDIATDLRFTCTLACGIELTWSVDIEPHSANGSNEYQINSGALADVIGRLSATCAKDMRLILSKDAQKVRARADEFMKAAQKQYGDASILESLARPTP